MPQTTERVRLTYRVESGDAYEDRELPFVVGVLADLGGQPETPAPRLRERKFVQIDRDNFDAVLSRMAPRLALDVENVLTAGGAPLRLDLRFRGMEDFEPDRIAAQSEPLRDMLQKRTRLANLRGIMNNELEDRLQAIVHSPEELERVASELADATPRSGGIVGRLAVEGRLGRNMDERVYAQGWLREFFSEFLAGTLPLSKDTESMLLARIVSLDRLLSAQVARIMHAPEFQQLEAAWRGLEYLVSRVQSGGRVKTRVLSVTKKELLRDFQRAPEFDQSAIFKKVYEEEYGMIGGEPFAVLIGDYYFDASPEDVELLEKISSVAAAAHAPFLAAAGPAMFNFAAFTELDRPRSLDKVFDTEFYRKWKSFRDSDDSRYTALVLPRILLRQPYGEDTMPVEAFRYGEFIEGRSHSSYLWGNPAYALAARLTSAFETYGWCAAIRGEEDGGLVEGLPVHRISGDEGEEIQCPTEAPINDRRESELVWLGFIPLLHRKGSATAVFRYLPSCARVTHQESAKVAGRLEYLLAASRFVHYLKSIIRDKITRFPSAVECQQYLNEWLAGYIHPGAVDAKAKAAYPLADARIEVAEVPGKPGAYIAAAWFKPHFQLYPPQESMRAVANLECIPVRM